MKFELLPTDALLVVDVQYDFLEGGALAVPNSKAIVPVIASYVKMFAEKSLPVIASRDWHPPDHCSFAVNNGPWPVHCVAGTRGAELSSEIDYPENVHLVSKGTNPEHEAYSAFDGTGLKQYLLAHTINRLYICGLATDYCVLATVRDALKNGFEVVVLKDAVQAVNVQPGDGDQALDEMKEGGARFAEKGEPA